MAVTDEWTVSDWDMVITSLEYAKRRFSEYQGYPSYNFKLQRLAEVQSVMDKARTARKATH